MNCPEHKNEELANCPSCLAEYWKAQYTQVKTECNRLRAALEMIEWIDDYDESTGKFVFCPCCNRGKETRTL